MSQNLRKSLHLKPSKLFKTGILTGEFKNKQEHSVKLLNVKDLFHNLNDPKKLSIRVMVYLSKILSSVVTDNNIGEGIMNTINKRE